MYEAIGDYEYTKKDLIGHGAFAIVYKGRRRDVCVASKKRQTCPSTECRDAGGDQEYCQEEFVKVEKPSRKRNQDPKGKLSVTSFVSYQLTLTKAAVRVTSIDLLACTFV